MNQVTLPPLAVLNLMPKSPLGPPGLWLAVRMMPPMALIFLMMQDTAGVERMPFCPMTKRPIWKLNSKTNYCESQILTPAKPKHWRQVNQSPQEVCWWQRCRFSASKQLVPGTLSKLSTLLCEGQHLTPLCCAFLAFSFMNATAQLEMAACTEGLSFPEASKQPPKKTNPKQQPLWLWSRTLLSKDTMGLREAKTKQKNPKQTNQPNKNQKTHHLCKSLAPYLHCSASCNLVTQKLQFQCWRWRRE